MKIIVSIIFSFLIVAFLSAQTERIRITGKVTDSSTGESLPGVNIVIEGASIGTITDMKGMYSIMVSGESQTLVFKFLGFIDEKVVVGNSRTHNVEMIPDVTALGEVVVTAQAKGQRGAIMEQINSNTIKNVVAADRLQENPDANAAEAIGRLPGISLMRGGGEGQGIVIRGMSPAYSKVTLNGVEMPSTGDDRSTNISGVSQYMLQGVEVFKALTSDMEADAVAGTINLQLRETPGGFQSKVMAQGGYNNMNSYWGNYKLAGDISNRLFNEKLGVSLSLSAERVMRSTQTMGAGYSSGNSADEIDILINSIGLNAVENIIYRRSAMLSFDYKISPSTILNFYSLYNYSNNDYSHQVKSYGTSGTGSIGYNFAYNPYGNNNIWQNVLSSRTMLDFMDIDYGIAYSYTKLDDPKSRSWDLMFQKMPTPLRFTEEERRKDPSELIPLYNDDIYEVIEDVTVSSIGTSTILSEDKNFTAYLDFKIPFKLSNIITGHIKTGGRYRNKDRLKEVTSGGAPFITNQFSGPEIQKRLDWVQLNKNDHILAIGLPEGNIESFLSGQYDFGSTFSFDRLNEISDAWEQTSQYWKDYAEANGGWGATLPNGASMPSSEKSDYVYNIANSIMNDQDIVEHYYATYFLTEFKFGKWVMFMPGVRYEKTETTMEGFRATEPTLPSAISNEISGVDTMASRSDEFFLPALHLRINPHKKFYIHGAYTQTLRRPNFNDISPNTYSAVRITPPHTYITQTPELKTERWTSFDLQFTFHGEKAGLLSLSGFYKTVEDKMWTRSWTRLPGDPLVGFFGDADQVSITQPQNHEYPIYLRGFETEIQTSFWYLPKPFNYFTTSLNYTYTDSETQYPVSWTEPVTVFPPGGGRPTVYLSRIDTTISGRMTYQPKHIVNASLGFNKGGLNIWLSWQYNGDILIVKTLNKSAVTQNGEMDHIKQSFQRWDLQVSYKFGRKLLGLEILGNFANLSDYMEVRNLRGDVRPTYLENYGWTADLGIRYRF